MDLSEINLSNVPGPDTIISYRAKRYTGGEGASLDGFAERDRELLHELYRLLSALHAETQTILDSWEDSGSIRALDPSLISQWLEFLASFSSEFGSQRRPDSVPRAIYHDLRGGALTLAHFRVQDMSADTAPSPENMYSLFYAVRDHLKIMRNCVRDIDPERREHDRRSNSHSMELLRQKWSGYRSGRLRIDFESDYDGPISSSCLEFSSLDRVLYNMINNASNHAADGRVRVIAKQLRSRGNEDIRFATANSVSEKEAVTLSRHCNGNFGDLFLSDFTIGGTGIGLQIVREIVANAYGVADQRTVVEKGYVGAELQGRVFICWCHWPIMG
ncbi:MAG: hypothetical protein ACLFM0_07650 [Spirochaetales bacterium]